MTIKIDDLVLSAVQNIGNDTDNLILQTASLNTPLFGALGVLDSLSLVTLVANLEEKVSELFDRDIIIADERAMSQTRSPFLTAKTLSDYIQSLMELA